MYTPLIARLIYLLFYLKQVHGIRNTEKIKNSEKNPAANPIRLEFCQRAREKSHGIEKTPARLNAEGDAERRNNDKLKLDH